MSAMLNDVKERYKRKNKVLYTRDSDCLQKFLFMLRLQKHKTIVLWSIMQIERIAKELDRDERIDEAIVLCKKWAKGEVKMPVAKKALLAVHSMAKETDDVCKIALFHAIGQGCASVHVETHAIGICLYELTAITLKHGIEKCEDFVMERIMNYEKELEYCARKINEDSMKWADFLNKDVVNKEMKLYLKNKVMETDRIVLRTLTIADDYAIYKSIHHDKKVLETFLAQYYDNFEMFDFNKMLTFFKKNKQFYYGIELKDTKECIGLIFENSRHNDEIEVGYAISSSYWNKGYVSESLQVLIDMLFENGVCNRICAKALSHNKASLRVMEKCGMNYSHINKDELEWHGKIHDVVCYEKTKRSN